jgi:hypothetical protein
VSEEAKHPNIGGNALKQRGRRWNASDIARELGLPVDTVLAVFHKAVNGLVEDRADYVDIDGFGQLRIRTVPARVFPTKNGVKSCQSHSYVALKQSPRTRKFVHEKKPGVSFGAPNVLLMHQGWLAARGKLPGGGNRFHKALANGAKKGAK